MTLFGLSDPVLLWCGNVLVQVAIVAAAALAISVLLRRQPALRYRLLRSAMMLILVCPIIVGVVQFAGSRLGVPTIRWSQLQWPTFSTWRDTADPRGEAAATRQTAAQPLTTTRKAAASDRTPPQMFSEPLPPVRAAIDPQTAATPPAVAAPHATLRGAALLLVAIWAGGTLLLATRLLVSFRRLRRLLQTTERNTNQRLETIYLAAWQSIGGHGDPPALVLSGQVSGPIAAGWPAPKVVLPASLPARVSAAELRDILLHELAHVRRRDQIGVFAQHVMAAIFWIHPLVHILNRKLAQSREEVCDNFVLRVTNPPAYSRTLLHLANIIREPIGIPCAVGLFASRWKLEHRIAGLLDSRRNHQINPGTAGRGGVAFATMLLVAVVALSTFAPAQDALEEALCFLNSDDPSKDSIGDDLPPKAVMRFGTSRFQPASGTEMRLSPDDQVIVTLHRESIVGSDAQSGKQLWSQQWHGKYGEHIMGPAYGQHFIDFFDNGAKFATTGRGNQVHVWDTRTGTAETVEMRLPRKPLPNPRGQFGGRALTSVDATADGKLFAVGGSAGMGVFTNEGEAAWFLVNSPDKPIEIGGGNRDRLTFSGDYATAIFSPDDETLAAVLSQDPQTIQFFNPTTAEVMGEIETPAKPVRMTFSPDGKSLYTTQRDCGIRSYSTETFKLEWELVPPPDENGAESYASAIDCSPDGRLLAVGMPIGPKNWIYLVDAKTGERLSILKSDMWKPWAVQFSADSETLYSNGWDGVVRRWNVASGDELPLPEWIRVANAITISPDGKLIAFADGDGNVRIVDRQTGMEQQRIAPEKATAEVLLFSPDSTTIHIGGARDENVGVESRRLTDGETVNAWQWPRGADSHSSVEELATTQDGKYLAAAVFRQHAAYIWETTSGEQIATLKHQEIYGLDFSPDGDALATVGWDKALRIWEPTTGEQQHEIMVADHFIDPPAAEQFIGGRAVDVRMYGVRFAPSGKQLAIAHMGGLTAWDVTDLEEPQRLFFARGRFTFGALDYAPDGQTIAAGGSGGDVALYDSQTGAGNVFVGKHRGYVYTVRFGADSSQLVSGGGRVSYLWDSTPQE